MAKTSAQSIMRSTSKVPQSALKGAKQPLLPQPPAAVGSGAAPLPPMGAPRAEPDPDRIPAVHAPVRPAHLPPAGAAKAEEARNTTALPAMGATGAALSLA